MIVLLLLGCGQAPFEPYFLSDGPVIERVVPDSTVGFTPGQTVRIEGSGLAETVVVSFGGRNAQVLSMDATSVEVVLPAPPPGGGALEVAVATAEGLARLEEGFRVEVPLGSLIQSEVASLAIVAEDCAGCGVEAGQVVVSGWIGHEQPGYAMELAGLSVSQLPPVGSAITVGPPALTSVSFVPQPADLTLSLVADRDWSAEIERLEERQLRLGASDDPAIVRFFNEEGCETEEAGVLSGAGDSLVLDAAVGASPSAWLGFETSAGVGFTTTASVEVSGDAVVSPSNGIVTRYDADLGELVADEVAGRIGLDDLRPGVLYDVVRTRSEVTEVLGQVTLGPDLDVSVDWDGAMTVSVLPSGAEDMLTVVQITATDPSTSLVGEPVVVGRLLGHVGQEALVIPESLMDTLPEGATVQVRVSRHQLHRLTWDETGDLLIDWVQTTTLMP